MNKQEYLLTCLEEECAEIIQRISKVKRFGLDEIQIGQNKNNLYRIQEEISDFVGVIEKLSEDADIHIGLNIRPQIAAKKLKLDKFMDYSKKLGILNEES